MKKIFLSVMAVASALTMMAQTQPTACDATLEFKFCFPSVGKDTIKVASVDFPYSYGPTGQKKNVEKAGDTTFIFTDQRGCDSTISLHVKSYVDARFTDYWNNAKQYRFAPGNLQYRASANGTAGDLTHLCADETQKNGEWRFAPHQYDIIGADNANISATYTGWIDLIAFRCSGYNGHEPWWSQTNNHAAYLIDPNGDGVKNSPIGANKYYDPGEYNTIGTYAPGTWRLPTNQEWQGIVINCENNNRAGFAQVNGVNGIMLLCDGFNLPSGLTFDPITSKNFNLTTYNNPTNVYTEAQWQQLEAAGAIFLPNTYGYRSGTDFYRNGNGYYMTSTQSNVTGYPAFTGAFMDNQGGTYWADFHGSCYRASAPCGLGIRLIQPVVK